MRLIQIPSEFFAFKNVIVSDEMKMSIIVQNVASKDLVIVLVVANVILGLEKMRMAKYSVQKTAPKKITQKSMKKEK